MTNKIFAFVGPHGSGKAMLISQLMTMGIHYIPTYTTRPKQRNEFDARHYNFVSKTDFFKMEFISHVTYKGHYRGILKKDVLDALQEHKISTVILDANGVKQLNKLLKGNLETIFIMSDYVTLVDRMIHLGQKNEEIKYHLEYAESNNEFEGWKITDYVVKNVRGPSVALNQILAIMGLMQVFDNKKLKELVDDKEGKE